MSDLNDPNVIYGGDIHLELIEKFKSLGSLIINNLTLGGDKVVLIDGSTQKQITFNDLKDQTVKLASAMYSWGIRKGDVVGIISENCVEFPAIVFATTYLGAISAPMNIFYSKREIEHSLSLSSPKLIFVSSFAADKVIACTNRSVTKNLILINRKTKDSYAYSLKDFLQQGAFDHGGGLLVENVDLENDVAFILNSSGTTGLSKGVQLTHSNVLVIWSIIYDRIKEKEAIYKEDAVFIHPGPWFHVFGLMIMQIVALSKSWKLVFLPKYDLNNYLAAISKNKVNIAYAVPPIMVSLSKSPLVDKYDLTCLKQLHSGAAPLSKEVQDGVAQRFHDDLEIVQGYGMSETTLAVISQHSFKKPGSVGTLFKGVYVKVIDENGNSLGMNQRGELCFKGPLIMKGYIGNNAATKDAIRDGWLHTGDIGYYDEDQQFYIVDRIKELIKYKAYQSAPAEIEAVLLSHRKIKDAGVIGIPDEECGELPLAYVVKQPDVNLSEKEVIDFVASLVSKPKQLHGGVRFIHEIPKNPSGKILRKDLREMYKKTHLNSKL